MEQQRSLSNMSSSSPALDALIPKSLKLEKIDFFHSSELEDRNTHAIFSSLGKDEGYQVFDMYRVQDKLITYAKIRFGTKLCGYPGWGILVLKSIFKLLDLGN